MVFPDGSQVGGVDFSDGVARWLDDGQLDTLANRGEVSLAGTRWPIPDGPTLTAGPNSPLIKRDDLRVPEEEYKRILAAINGEPSAPRKIEGTAPTPARRTPEPWEYLIKKSMELYKHLAEVGMARTNLQQSRQDLAILREELCQLEAKPEYLSAVESFVAVLKMQYEPIAKSDQQDLIECRAAEIKDWSALLARLRSEQVDTHKRATEQTDDEIDVNGLVAWQAEILEQWSAITKQHGEKPSARNVMKWLKKNGRRDRIPEEQKLAESVCWIDREGRPHSVTLGRIGSVLSEWRGEGKIPCR